jgi:hypothetical protein
VDIVRLRIPYSFVRSRVRISWRDALFGLTNELLDPLAAIELAAEQVDERADPILVALAAGANDWVLQRVERLAENESPRSDDEIRDKWLYLVLAWIYENRDRFPDPLQRVEEVYADFGYPEPLAKFVRYMPMEGPDLGSREANERRLFERWKQYLDEVGTMFTP